MATLVSSSSAPIAAFCTMTVKTGVDRSGKTSRRRSDSHTAPITDAATRTRTAKTGRPNDTFRMRRMSVLVLAAEALLGLGFQQEGAFDDDGVRRLKAAGHFDLAAEVTSAPDRPHPEGAFA